MAGGVPANLAATITELGGSASFAGKVRNDSFGDVLIKTLQQYNVDTTMIAKDAKLATTIAFVSLTSDGERDFQFNHGVDKNLTMKDIPLDGIGLKNNSFWSSYCAIGRSLVGDLLKVSKEELTIITEEEIFPRE